MALIGNNPTMATMFDPNTSTYTVTGSTSNASWGVTDTTVSIDTSGIVMKQHCDIVLGDRSLKDFMDKVEERLNILRVNPHLEDKWEQLAELGKQYRELEKELLEKERMWKILKDTK